MTSIKERVIHEAIARIEKRIAWIKDIVWGCHASEIIQLEIDVIKTVQQMDFRDPAQSQKAQQILSDAQKRKKQLLKKAKHAQKSGELITEMVKLESEQDQLRSELFYINMRKEKV